MATPSRWKFCRSQRYISTPTQPVEGKIQGAGLRPRSGGVWIVIPMYSRVELVSSLPRSPERIGLIGRRNLGGIFNRLRRAALPSYSALRARPGAMWRTSRPCLIASPPAREGIALAVPGRPAHGLVAHRFGQVPFIAISVVEVHAALRSAAWICQLHPSRAIIREAARPAYSRAARASAAVAGGLTVINCNPFHPGRPAVYVARPCSAPPSDHLARRGRTAG